MTQPDTSHDAYKAIRENNEDVSLRRRIALELLDASLTTHELNQRIQDHSLNAIRPRVNELLRMGCVVRDGKRTNPSGHDAYVHHLTNTGERYVQGEVDPELGPSLSEAENAVVEVACDYVDGRVDRGVLGLVVGWYRDVQARFDPKGNDTQ